MQKGVETFFCPAKAGCLGPRHRQANASHPRQSNILWRGKNNSISQLHNIDIIIDYFLITLTLVFLKSKKLDKLKDSLLPKKPRNSKSVCFLQL